MKSGRLAERLIFSVSIDIIISMRIRLNKKYRDELFFRLRQRKILSDVSVVLNISSRTLKAWEKGENTIPEESFKKVVSIAGRKIGDFEYDRLSENWNAENAARKGGFARIARYGNPGTKEGRRKGGFASLKIHNKRKTGFVVEKTMFEPKHSEKLAEMLGILVGDGHLSEYQTSMTTSSITDIEHASFVSKLFKNLFLLEAPIRKNTDSHSVDVTVSSKKLVGFLISNGMTKGNKIHNGLHVPVWIMNDKKFWKPFIRGLFDTDGCVYLDCHHKGGKTYKHIGWTISSNADKLVRDIINILEGLDFSPSYRKSQHSVYLRKQDEIKRYFSEIGTHNPKHASRYQKFIGGVA